jgi:hypothetical protein
MENNQRRVGYPFCYFVNGDKSFPDLNRLFVDCVWNADAQRWEIKQ